MKTENETTNGFLITSNTAVTCMQEASRRYASLSPAEFADHIEEKHHHYFAGKISAIKNGMETLCKVHGTKHKEVFEIKRVFSELACEVQNHLKKARTNYFSLYKKTYRCTMRTQTSARTYFRNHHKTT